MRIGDINFENFDLKEFIDHIDNSSSYSEEQVNSQSKTIETFQLLLNNRNTYPEVLEKCSLINLEWVLDMILYWPSWEAGIEDEEDFNHYGIQYFQIKGMVQDLSSKKSIKKKVSFL